MRAGDISIWQASPTEFYAAVRIGRQTVYLPKPYGTHKEAVRQARYVVEGKVIKGIGRSRKIFGLLK